MSESSQSVAEWLNGLRLDQYCSVFQEAGLGTLWECQDLSSAQLQRMGVALPGHRKRILGSLHKLLPSAPVARERTKFRRTADDGATENSVAGRRPPPIPPRVTPNRPPVPFTPGSITTATAPEPISIPEQKETPTPASRAKPIPTPRPRPEHLPLKGPAQQLQTSERKPSRASPTLSSSSSERFHLYGQCSSPTQGEVAVPPLPPKSYTVGVSKEPRDVPNRHPVPPPRVSCNTTASPRSTLSRSPPTIRYRTHLYLSGVDIYSKRIIPTVSITGVVNVGEQKFEVVTHNRTFLFRAESDSERSEWVTVLKSCVGVSHARTSLDMTFNPCVSYEMKGYLELRGLRSKLYTVVCADKVFLYKNTEDYRLGIGITSIDMNVGNVKEVDRRAFDLTTPYRIFSFVADTDQLKDQWVEAMRNSIAEALSNYEVAERIWAEPSNQMCADCSTAKPEWAAINLAVVFCKRCAGEHRGLGQSISKVRSLKMDKKVWTDDLIQLFLALGNERANQFWAANVPPSEALTLNSSSEERRRFIAAKYREGKYRRYHPLFGNQRELNNALCINVQSSDVCETLALVFCGADVSCDTGDPELPSPIALAQHHRQNLQVEFLMQNRNTGVHIRDRYYSDKSILRLLTFDLLTYRTPEVRGEGCRRQGALHGPALQEGKRSRRWCVLNDGNFSYYESDKNATPNGGLKMKEIVCLAVSPPETHGYDYTFELYSEAERLYLFGTDNPEAMREWVKSIAKSFIPAGAEDLLLKDFVRIGRLRYKDRLNREMSRLGWFCLVGSSLHIRLEEHTADETIDLQKLLELSIQPENEVLVLVERGRTLYIEGERKLDFQGWAAAIQRAAGSSGDTLSQQQLTEADIPVIVERCIHFTTQYGLTSEGIYRKSGVNSKIAALLEEFRRNARCVWLKEGEHQVDDVSNVLKRFFRDIEEGLFGLDAHSWLSATDESSRICQYRLLFSNLPRVNQATLRALVNHLYCVQRFADLNQMNLHNLAIVFGPTLFQADGKDYSAGRVIEDLIQHYVTIFDVNEQQLKKQLDEITYIIKLRDNLAPKAGTGSGDFICTVYLEEKKETAEQHVKIPATMTAAELTFEVLDRRKISVREKDYWCCFEVNEKEEMERPLHYQEKVLPIFHSLGIDSHLLVKKHFSMEAMLVYLASKVEVSKHGMMKFREERSLLGLSTGSFNDRYFILTSTSLRLYKEVRVRVCVCVCRTSLFNHFIWIPEGDFKPFAKNVVIVQYLCCDTQNEMREWFATFMSIQNGGRVWPAEWLKSRAASRSAPLDARFGNVSLIPLRGSENEMRNSVAAFTADPLAVSLISQSQPGLSCSCIISVTVCAFMRT
uniref:Arf-GAP with Rho-GAP domain, ANK repeat and PH domain-containing protein 1 n=1 Tax=Cyprinus carpio carpio TaxID=630221 RepID=A0A9J8BQE0_CYPCA